MQSTIPPVSAVYFPFTFITPPLAETLCECFHAVVLYHPVGCSPLEGLQPLVDQGRLDLRVPFEEMIDKSALAAQLNSFTSWAQMHEGADFKYLKAVGNQIAPPDPLAPRIASQIKGTADKSSFEGENRDRSIQAFLHLAHNFDRQSWELREQLDRFRHQHETLQTFFRTDDQKPENHMPTELFPGRPEDQGDLLIEKRMAAWSHLFQKDPVQTPVLLTNSRSALARLVDSAKDKVEVLKFEIPYRKRPAHAPPWKDQLQAFFHELLTARWGQDLRQHIEKGPRELDKTVESWKRAATGPELGQESVSFLCYLLPNQSPYGLLSQRCGLEVAPEQDGPARNTVVGLVEVASPSPLPSPTRGKGIKMLKALL